MREIKFKAKSIKTGEWVYGYYVDEGLGNHLIVYYSEKENKVIAIPIIRETLCQYSGRNDCAGIEIYEHDRLWNNYWDTYGVISFKNGKFSFNWDNTSTDLSEIEKDSTVTENIFDWRRGVEA
ncbi:YopX family protein [Enterococcus sp. BWR-S5]|uniref:YopX family protein n=1 Tax=Enterococcus sp. BWR-S5 TaxID=2787714 RepID=UPI001920FB1A|nr:hypothetical protein [Enterococcus sp. BWR-S5]